jgi:myo-inositol-1-phosphate synthase
VSYYAANPDRPGLIFRTIGGYSVHDITFVAAFDVDARKVGRPLEQAIFAAPNNTTVFEPTPVTTDVRVRMAPVFDGMPDHLLDYPVERRFLLSDQPPCDVEAVLRDSGAEVLVNYMPVGAQQATEFYAEMCLRTGVSLINCVPCFIVSDPGWAQKFTDRLIPVVGDDIKSQVGATISHRVLARLFQERGVQIDRTYQLNTGGNTDFLNMLCRDRLASKRASKTEAVQSQLEIPLNEEQVHIGPSDYVPFLKDNKVCFLRIEGTGFGGIPMHLEMRLSVEDSPNSAGVVVDAIRCCKLARDAGLSGPIEPVCAWTMKRPPRQMPDNDARIATEEFISEASALGRSPRQQGHGVNRE